jgi:hypothetical protein
MEDLLASLSIPQFIMGLRELPSSGSDNCVQLGFEFLISQSPM